MLTTVAIVLVLSLHVGRSCALVTEQDNTCLNSYSWSARGNGEPVYQYTVTETTEHCLDCQLDDIVRKTNREHAEKVYEVKTGFYGSMEDNGDVITCLNITFEINRHSASNLEGLLFTLEDHWDGDYEECFRLNFTTRLTSSSLFDTTTENRNRLFHFDCFCDLKISDGGPNYDYTLKIRSLPFQNENCTLVDDQTVTSYVKVPVCDDPVRTWTDKYCQKKQKAETWNPFIAFYQAFPKYNTLRLTFEPAPPYYLITQYEIYILNMMRQFIVDGHIIYVADLNITPVEVDGSSVNATSRDYADVNAKPGDSITVTIIAKNGIREVFRRVGPVLIFQETWNPFIAFYQAFPDYNILRLTFEPAAPSYPITLYEIYIHDMMTGYSVDGHIIYVADLNITRVEVDGSSVNATSRDYAEVNAKPGDSITVTIIAMNGIDEVFRIVGPVIIFQENPCDVNTCGPLGSCIPLGHDYYCKCQEGTVNLSNHTCIRDPCESNTCEPLGSCIRLGDDYFCQCQEGALNRNNHTCIQSTDQARDSSWQVITGAAVVGALVVFILIAVGLYRKHHRKHHRRFLDPIELVPLPTIPDPQTSDDILFAYPEENSEFVKLVEKLAIYILRRGGIHPVLPSQHTLEMGKQGQELWLETTSTRAKKILWICSAQMTESKFSNFEKLLTLTKDDREERKDKHVVCFFSDVSSRKDVPRRLGDFKRFNLLEDLESMCFYLKDIERHTLYYSESMPYISGLEPSAERTALEDALEEWAGKDSGFTSEEPTFAGPFSAEDGDLKTMADAWMGLTTLPLQDESDSDTFDSV
eukprot:XP_003726556.1 PREDICTED: uncharacterized protein LOC100893626 isoform X1 [Strongylocentrotus purpuratus]